MASSEAWFVSERAENLAIVLLTRFPVHVTRETAAERSLDLRVAIDPDGPGPREFGVILKGSTHIGQLVDDYPQIALAAQKTLKGCVFPVAFLAFDVTTDDGFFGWLLAPAITEDGARLVETESFSLEPATNDRIANALSEIRQWYEARPLRTEKVRKLHTRYENSGGNRFQKSKSLIGPIESGTLGWTKSVTIKDSKTGYQRAEKKARGKLKKS